MRIIMLILAVVYFADGHEIKKGEIAEARGKGKYALVLNLAIVLAAKVGLYKIFLGIAFLVAAIKAMVLMAWSLAIYRYVPNWAHQKISAFPDNNDRVQPPSIHFLYVAATKLFVLKIVYGALFYVIVYKAWHLVLWLLKYIKANKHHHVEYEHAIYDHGHEDFGHDHYGHDPYGAYEKPIYGRKEYSSKVYDSDGSYSVQG
ncbi:unnamed protein product [Pieris brassicae]|uniref:Uncharacterized protein n=1 Tax=Pieris brassicae TaxID=7116 RepID=A0A9P0T1Y5_PIEBR|nr:unnamed protein product [Pieris brassicae]